MKIFCTITNYGLLRTKEGKINAICIGRYYETIK